MAEKYVAVLGAQGGKAVSLRGVRHPCLPSPLRPCARQQKPAINSAAALALTGDPPWGKNPL